LFSWDMIFLIYALTWSSADTMIWLDGNGKGIGWSRALRRWPRERERRTEHVEAIFLDTIAYEHPENDLHGLNANLRCKVLGRVDAALESG
jgi:hypothetical protein